MPRQVRVGEVEVRNEVLGMQRVYVGSVLDSDRVLRSQERKLRHWGIMKKLSCVAKTQWQ